MLLLWYIACVLNSSGHKGEPHVHHRRDLGHGDPDRNVVDRPRLVVARVRGAGRSGSSRSRAACPGFSGTIEGGETAVDRGNGRRDEHHDVRRDTRRSPAVARLLRRRALPRAPLRRRRPSSSTATSSSSRAISRSRARRSRSSCGHVPRRRARPRRATSGSGSSSRAPIDRTDFGLELERAAARRRLPAAERRHAPGDLRGGEGGLR